MNYITLNGVSSNTITGLLISELPPISKPLMRTQIDLIDGRDGDIVTNLGYSAYDKVMKIGLRGSYDINSVISFFASEGNVTFSNEADKYYRYQIISQIDFERLVRFRTAEVTFHCQPYKYSTTENARSLSSGNNTVTNSGNVISKPTLTINGSNTITVSLNGQQIFTITLGTNDSITINAETMEAYKGGILRNRAVVGDYSALALNVGSNTLRLQGTGVSGEITNYSRWL